MEKIVIQNLGNGLGDFFILELTKDEQTSYIMVDGHTAGEGYTPATRELLQTYGRIDYLIVTHIDRDHINGVIKMMEDEEMKPIFQNTIILYNYVTNNVVNYKHAETFEKMLEKYTVLHTAKCSYENKKDDLVHLLSLCTRQEFDITNKYAYITLIAPNGDEIREVYNDYIAKKDLKDDKKRVTPEKNLTNHASIVFLLEFAGKKLLFMGDNSIKIIQERVNSLKSIKGKKIDLIKIGHHGAWEENDKLVSFADDYSCQTFLVTGEEDWEKKKEHPSECILKELNDLGKEIKMYTKVQIDGDKYSNIKLDCSQEIIVLEE